uniref:hypothetical protein n=1 Tax=Treponema sp. TaxID=166 RepID=UPI003890E2E4
MFSSKKIFSYIFFILLTSIAFSQSSDSEGEFDDFDSIFETSQDVDEPVVTEEVVAGANYNVQLGSVQFPVEVSGNLNAELGGAYVREDGVNDATFYFDFKNYANFIIRPDKYLALKGTIKSSMPADSSDSESEQKYHNLLYVYELYFDYLFWDSVYITAGKKKSVWGNIRLFSDYYDESESISTTTTASTDDTETDNIDDAQYTNILYDSRDYVSGIIRIPVGNHTFTALAMYDESDTVSSSKTVNMSLAASAEFVFWGTSVNFFGRRFRLKEPEDAPATYEKKLPIVGLELKSTLFGFDIYGQSMARVADGTKTKELFSSKFEDKSVFNRVISTVGTYRLWSENAPYFGFNAEFQNIYRPNPASDETFFTNRFAVQLGMAKI